MSFFSDLEKKINQAGQAVTDKAGSIADSSKLNYRISSEEKALAELYRQLGSAYYTERGSCPDEKLKATCESISQALERIADLRRQEAAARGKRLCPHCGSDCDPYQPFCYVCRGELTPAASGPRLCPLLRKPAASGRRLLHRLRRKALTPQYRATDPSPSHYGKKRRNDRRNSV